MFIELKLFTDLINTLGKVAGRLKPIVNLPKAEQEAMHQTLDETYHPISGDAERQRDKDTLDPVGASWDTIDADYIARNANTLLKEAGILKIVTPTSVLAKL